jgi:hypothetical protein
MLVKLPNGIVVKASSLFDRDEIDPDRDFGLYMDSRWSPTWPANIIDWPDFGVPAKSHEAAHQIQSAFDRACGGERLEIGCLGGTGRTGTVLACLAILAGVAGDEAVDWVRRNYNPRAVETRDQEQWVLWFASWSKKETA